MSENQKYFVADNKISIIEAYQGKGYGKQEKIRIGSIVLACVWILHILYISCKVKTIAE